ncbi:MAG: glycosyltransferase [Verrucomicrobiales bacterium]
MPSSDFPISAIDDPLRVAGKYFCAGDEVCFLKAVTFGPFPAGAFQDGGKEQLRRIREELGANTLRLYEIPTLEFLHECARVGLRVFVTLPWSQHVDFLRHGHVLAEADLLLLETIDRFRGHPALAGYFVANEIETTLVRWMGPRRAVEQLERFIDLGHANDPHALFAYANYPSTEYLLPRNQDFVAFNLYLESRDSLASYLRRLQNLAGDKPLFVSEFGVDSKAHGEEIQAEILGWHVEEVCASGSGGTTVFSWSDLWLRGGQSIEGWDFGLTRRDATPKPALETVREIWEPLSRPGDEIELPEVPTRMSVIVCTYRGVLTLVPCLNSLTELDYPDYEVILVNDGDDPRVNELAANYESIRLVSIEHQGLGAARNVGAKAARGDILVYTDDDCIAEPDWLKWLAIQFRDGVVGCAGGPNIPPPPESGRQARIAAAPGGPAHVLLDDSRAEHLPGCNLAIRRMVFDEVGGFDPVFRTAGDDVDFCWRVADAGYELRFHAAAFIWHYRRFSARTYFRQQIGYGKAEALLMPIHQERFRTFGGAEWEGRVYTPQLPMGQVVYHGRYGYEPFQLVYPSPESGFSDLLLHVLWWFACAVLAIAGVWFPPLWFAAALMALASLRIARKKAGRCVVVPVYDSLYARWALGGLVLAQGFLRSSARVFHSWRSIRWSRSLGSFGQVAVGTLFTDWWKLGGELYFWSDKGVGRDELLEKVRESMPHSTDDPTGETDVILKSGWFWNWALLTVTEYHEDEGRLTRLRLLARPQLAARLIVLPLLIAFPIAVWFGFGFKSEFLTLAIAYVAVAAASRLFMRLKLRGFRSIGRSVGLKKI